MMGITNILTIQCMLDRMPPRPVASQVSEVTHRKGRDKIFPRGRASTTEPSKNLERKSFLDCSEAAKENSMFL